MFKHHRLGLLLAASLALCACAPLLAIAADPPACQAVDGYTEELARTFSEANQRVTVTFFRAGKAQAIIAILLAAEKPIPPSYMPAVDRVDRIAIAGSTNFLVFSSGGCALGMAQIGPEEADKLVFTAMKSITRNFLTPRNFIT